MCSARCPAGEGLLALCSCLVVGKRPKSRATFMMAPAAYVPMKGLPVGGQGAHVFSDVALVEQTHAVLDVRARRT